MKPVRWLGRYPCWLVGGHLLAEFPLDLRPFLEPPSLRLQSQFIVIELQREGDQIVLP